MEIRERHQEHFAHDKRAHSFSAEVDTRVCGYTRQYRCSWRESLRVFTFLHGRDSLFHMLERRPSTFLGRMGWTVKINVRAHTCNLSTFRQAEAEDHCKLHASPYCIARLCLKIPNETNNKSKLCQK